MGLKKTEISYIKPGLAVGGASMADIELFKLFTKMGKKIDINVGFVDERMQMSLVDQGFQVSINPLFDRDHKFDSKSVSEATRGLKQIFDSSKLTIISQSYLGDASLFNEALSELLAKGTDNTQWLRSHDFIRDEEMYEHITRDGGLLSLPTTKAMEKYMKKLSSNAMTETLPYFISKDNFRRQSSDAPPKEVRERMGIAPRDFVIFQPSRVDPRKRVGKAVRLASELQKAMPSRRVILLVAGGQNLLLNTKRNELD
ncbi:MAG: hypothetical protein ABII21_04035 [bacterium]